MRSVCVRELKNNRATAIKLAREGEFVVMTNRGTPNALLVRIENLGMPDVGQLRLAIAASLFRDGVVRSGAAARMAGKGLAEMYDTRAPGDSAMVGR